MGDECAQTYTYKIVDGGKRDNNCRYTNESHLIDKMWTNEEELISIPWKSSQSNRKWSEKESEKTKSTHLMLSSLN